MNLCRHLKGFLQQRLPQVSYTDGRIKSLYNKYGPDKYNLPDQGYIARCIRWNCGCWIILITIPMPI